MLRFPKSQTWYRLNAQNFVKKTKCAHIDAQPTPSSTAQRPPLLTFKMYMFSYFPTYNQPPNGIKVWHLGSSEIGAEIK